MTTSSQPLPTKHTRKMHRTGSSSSESSVDRSISTGRGGAGNFSGTPGDLTEQDYKLPHLKSSLFTSGRGGQGNMTRNDPQHPEYARAMQDVEMRPRRPSDTEYHGVRGGAGNVFRPSADELMAAREYKERVKYDKSVPVDHSKHDYRGWADKGKDFLFKRRQS